MQILIGADIVPTKSNAYQFITGNANDLIGDDLLNILKQADYRIFNLEVPLTENETPITKCGKAMIASPLCITAFKEMGIDLLTLANNHILDQNEQGLRNTIKVLDESNIDYVGAGRTLEEAIRPFIFCCGGKKIGVYACAEHESSIATEHSCGANPFDPLESFDHIAELNHECDYLIVLYHGGKEHYRYPSPNLQKVCRKLVDKGADLVICQHSHCIGAEEKYKKATIIYGQGNFIFDGPKNDYWLTSILVSIGDGFTINYIPLQRKDNGIRLANNETGCQVLEDFQKRSREIQNPNQIESLYEQFARDYIADFLSIASGKRFGLITRIINRIIGNNIITNKIISMKYTQKKCITLLNRISCEANHELFIAGLRESIKKER